MSQLPRGIRNNNPGNIDKGTQWQGLALKQPDSRFCTFISPEYGIRAMAKIIQTYVTKYHLLTIRAIINRWAPPVENNTEAYIQSVAKAVKRHADESFPYRDRTALAVLIKAIIAHENGVQPYSDKVIQIGVDLALK